MFTARQIFSSLRQFTGQWFQTRILKFKIAEQMPSKLTPEHCQHDSEGVYLFVQKSDRQGLPATWAIEKSSQVLVTEKCQTLFKDTGKILDFTIYVL